MGLFDNIMGKIPIVGDIYNTVSQGLTNSKNRDWEFEMFNRTNTYNTPLEQRKRMEAAGFNPNLVYGHGSVVNTATRPSGVQGTAPQSDIAGAMSKYADAKLKSVQTQTESARVVTETMRQNDIMSQIALRATQALENATRTKGFEQDIMHKAQSFPHSMDAIQLENRNKSLDNFRKEVENSNYSEFQKLGLQKIKSELLSMQSTRDVQAIETQLKQFELQLSKLGLTKTDSAILRMFPEIPVIIKKAGEGLQKGGHWYIDSWKKIFKNLKHW